VAEQDRQTPAHQLSRAQITCEPGDYSGTGTGTPVRTALRLTSSAKHRLGPARERMAPLPKPGAAALAGIAGHVILG